MSLKNELIREYVRALITELNPQIDYGPSLSDIFVEPFKNAASVIKGELGKVSAKTQGIIAKVVNATLHTLGPQFFDKKFSEIDAYVIKGIKAIENDPDYGAAWKKIEPHAGTAASKLFFLADPVGFLTGIIMKKSATEAIDTAKPFLQTVEKARLEEIGRHMNARRARNERVDYEKILKSLSSRKVKEGLLKEEVLTADAAKAIMSNQDIQTLIRNSVLAKGMQGKLHDIANGTADQFLKLANQINAAKDAKALSGIFGVKIDATQANSLGEESTSADTLITEQIKQAALKRLVDSIATHLKKVGYNGQKNNIYYDSLTEVIEKISGMLG